VAGAPDGGATYNALVIPSPAGDDFLTTQWSLVLRAGASDDTAARQALAALCQRYWYPLYAYVRRRGVPVDQAEDVIQGFFARLLEMQILAGVTVEGGRFRSFLLTAVKNHLANERDRAVAEKRGGGASVLSLDLDSGESRLALEPHDNDTPERLFGRQWALTLLALVLERLEAEYDAADKSRLFELLKASLTGGSDRLPYAEIGREVEISEEAARQAASRLRKRYRELLREEVASTLASEQEVDDEIRGLFAVLG
jgi:RNA polymerase sigma-70 factor (ECF subfamily)